MGKLAITAVIIAGLPLFAIGSCQWQRIREMEKIRAALPVQYQDGAFVRYDVCDRIFGGYSYIFRLSPKAVQALKTASRAEKSTPNSGVAWNYEGMTGLMCLKPEKSEYRRLRAYLATPDSYSRKTAERSADYFIPSLGLVVGGYDPR